MILFDAIFLMAATVIAVLLTLRSVKIHKRAEQAKQDIREPHLAHLEPLVKEMVQTGRWMWISVAFLWFVLTQYPGLPTSFVWGWL